MAERMTREDVEAYVERMRFAHDLAIEEARSQSMQQKLDILLQLVASAHLFPHEPVPDDDWDNGWNRARLRIAGFAPEQP